jgi:hypothetical protein
VQSLQPKPQSTKKNQKTKNKKKPKQTKTKQPDIKQQKTMEGYGYIMILNYIVIISLAMSK